MKKTTEKQEVTISLTKAEALVLFDLLSRFSETGELDIQHKAETLTLWNVGCVLEKCLSEPFSDIMKSCYRPHEHRWNIGNSIKSKRNGTGLSA